MFDLLSRSAYDAAVAEHDLAIRPALLLLDAAIGHVVASSEKARLQTTRVLLKSGLFDADFYLKKYADIQSAQVDPLEHYIQHGDREGRMPNAFFFPHYYRREFMVGAPAERNTLEDYMESGERRGAKPNPAFDPRSYLTANPALSEFVDRPLFHFIRIGREAGKQISGIPAAVILPLLERIDPDAIPGSDDYYSLVTTKRALVEALGVQDGFGVFKQLISRPDQVEIHWKRLVSLREISRARPGAFRETAVAGEPFLVMPPVVIGEGNHRPLAAHTRSMFVACLIDARVRAGSNIVEVDDVAILDYQTDELSRIDDARDYDPAVFAATDNAAWIVTPRGDAAAIEIEEAFTLLGIRPGAFGHWMIEYLPKYIAASLSGALPRVPLLIQTNMPDSHRQALELMVPEGIDIIDLAPFTTARVRRLWCAPNQSNFPVYEVYTERFRWENFALPPARYAPIIREMALRIDRVDTCVTSVERVYLARESFIHHVLVNHRAVESAVEARGFKVVYPERLGFIEQAHLVRHAGFVVGPDGSQMFLAFFARPGTKLCILSNVEGVVEIQAEHNALYNEIGIDYTVFTGPSVLLDADSPWESDYEIQEEPFCRFLDQWLEP